MNAFERLGLAAAPVVSGEALREAFREAGRRAHPDVGGDGDFALLEEAKRKLGSAAGCLREWLEARGVAGEERGAVGEGLMEWFGRVGEVLQEADALIRRREAAQSALAKALLEGEVYRMRARLEEVQEGLSGEVAGRLEEVAGKSEGEAEACGWQMVRELGFLEKWQAQLRERVGRLW